MKNIDNQQREKQHGDRKTPVLFIYQTPKQVMQEYIHMSHCCQGNHERNCRDLPLHITDNDYANYPTELLYCTAPQLVKTRFFETMALGQMNV
jgi:hypothetical protein